MSQKTKQKNTNSIAAPKGSWGKRIWRIVRNTVMIFFVLSIVWVLIDWFAPVFVTPLMVQRSVESVFKGEMPKNSKTWVSIDEISPNMVQAVVASEDNLFLTHHGFSFEAMSKAFEHNLHGRKIRGGSTISQQTAKNVFLFPHRSYVRKGLEAYFTLLMELTWSKKRIMEVYLNVIEMGEGVYGVEAASQEFFGIHASQLSKGQAALIAACLPNPRRFKVNHPSGYTQRRQGQIVGVMSKVGPVIFDKTQPQPAKKHRKKHHSGL